MSITRTSHRPGVRLAEPMAATQRPIATAALAGAAWTPPWKSIPSWFALGTGDRMVPVVAGLIGEAAGAAASRSDGRVDFERVGVEA